MKGEMITDAAKAIGTEALWQRFREELDGFILRRVGNPADAEDIRQQVYLRIHRHLRDRAPPLHLRGWVYQIARNAIVDHRRRQAGRAKVRGSDDAGAWDVPTHDDAGTSGTAAEIGRGLVMLLEMLPKADAEALRWTELEGLTQADAAARAGVSLPAMKSRVQRARAKLRETLLACCEIELDARQRPIDYRCRYPQVCGCSEAGIEHCSPPDASLSTRR